MDPAAAASAAAESIETAPALLSPPPLSSEDSALVSWALSRLAATSAAAPAAFRSSLDAATARDAERLRVSREAAKEAEDIARRALGEIDLLAEEEEEGEEEKGRGAADDSDSAAASTSSPPLLGLVSSASAALEEATQRLRDADASEVALLLARGKDLQELHSRAVEICCGERRAGERRAEKKVACDGDNAATSTSTSPSSSSSSLLLVDSPCRDLEERLRQARRKVVLKLLSAIERADLRREAAERALAAAAAAAAARAPFAAQATAAAEHAATREIAELSKKVEELQVRASAASAAFSRRKKAAEKEATAMRVVAEENERSAASAKEETERNGKQLRTLRRENETVEAVESARLERLERVLESSAERGRAAEEARKVVAAALADEAKKVRRFFLSFLKRERRYRFPPCLLSSLSQT